MQVHTFMQEIGLYEDQLVEAPVPAPGYQQPYAEWEECLEKLPSGKGPVGVAQPQLNTS